MYEVIFYGNEIKSQKMPLKFKCTTPCNSCPYRKDAPLKHWDKSEFERLHEIENSQMGAVYGCHKNNGSVCIGWLMNQDSRGFPSIMLRMSFIKHEITREYLDKLHCKSEMFKSVNAMIKANYPEILK